MCGCVHACVSVCVCTRVCVCVYERVSVWICTCMCECVRVYEHVSVWVSVSVCACVRVPYLCWPDVCSPLWTQHTCSPSTALTTYSCLFHRAKFNIAVLHEFVRLHKFNGLDLVQALRWVLTRMSISVLLPSLSPFSVCSVLFTLSLLPRSSFLVSFFFLFPMKNLFVQTENCTSLLTIVF